MPRLMLLITTASLVIFLVVVFIQVFAVHTLRYSTSIYKELSFLAMLHDEMYSDFVTLKYSITW